MTPIAPTLLLAATLALGGCDALLGTSSTASPADVTPAPQARVCGRLDPERCAEVLGAVVARFPEVRRASLVVIDLGKDPAALDPGPDRYLVAFVPTDAVDHWMWPPTFLVTRSTTDWTILQWDGAKPLPGFFMQLLRSSGLPNL